MKVERQQQQAEELCGATVRALTGLPALRYVGRRLHLDGRPLRPGAPHLQTDPERDDFRSYRGAADGISLRLLLSDSELHDRFAPQQKVDRFIYDLLEQLRVESLVSDRYPGMHHNLEYRFTTWSLVFERKRLTETHVGLLLFTLAQVTWARFNRRAVLEQAEDLMEATRFHLMPLIGTPLAALVDLRPDQQGFIPHALELIRIIHELIDQETVNQIEKQQSETGDDDISRLAEFINSDAEFDEQPIAQSETGQSKSFELSGRQYRVFTRQYDRVVEASSQLRPELLADLRRNLDQLVKGQGINIGRLARKLSALLSRPARDGWLFDEEEGYIDARRLGQIVVSPSETRLYRQVRYLPVADCLVSILIDCSGSMTGQISQVATMVDILARALEQAGVSTEVLGYTTGAWNGGKSQQLWMAQGRPQYPGRMNELCHLVYKDADTSWRRARSNIAALLKPDLFREGIDGEAIGWACQRMAGRFESRKMLVVISDGCPMDTATNLANDRYYLDNHLKQVVEEQSRRGEVGIYGLGVGLDLSPFYAHSLAIELSENLGNHVFDDILQLLAGRHHR